MAERVGDGYTKEVAVFAAVLSCQTLDLRHDAADQCPNVKPWVASVRCVEMIAHLEPQILMDYQERTENSAETSNSTRPFQNYKGLLLVLPGLQVESLFYAVIKQLSCHPLVKRISCLMAKESGQPWHTGI